MDKEKIKKAVRMLLEGIGENPDREGLIDTPKRVANMYEEIFAGMVNDPADQVSVFFTEEHDEMVLVKDIPIYSMCEHHLLPFFGNAHIAYIPKNGKITGLSKLARVVDMTAKKPQLQERLTSTVANILMDKLDAQGVMVVIEAEHMCMSMRGIKKSGSKTITSAIRGIFKTNLATREEAMTLIRSNKSY